jgi:hypothetical protein
MDISLDDPGLVKKGLLSQSEGTLQARQARAWNVGNSSETVVESLISPKRD